ncbi:Metallo-dependent phosphatase-like protein [Roridomyces roridus]|uniref:Metallo-dependent phosphatase-like protein n=1 Tax=Roridomyces roridus TaxID=1738132 RepID=A0AAD7FPA0_9AGAR|nr:Metallo-dependent phosphatase-like protein [Roridomyces roridus]
MTVKAMTRLIPALLLSTLASASQQSFSVENARIVSQPSRPLQWGDINIISTTDTHGWLLGHEKASAPEPNYSGTWGDYASFVHHMKGLAVEKDVDLLLVDSGDLHDGTGLTDGFPPGGVDAQDSNEFFKQMPYDVLAIGNHELYKYENTLDMHRNFAPHFQGRYLSSNVNITVFDVNNKSVSVPVGSRFRKFQTRKGRSVTAFGVIFGFTTNDVNTTVQPVDDMVQEPWFLDAIADEPDLFLLVGHMPIARNKWPVVFEAIRKVHPATPIVIFGGHLHIRDCLQLDGRSMSLASGRYMETLGWMSTHASCMASRFLAHLPQASTSSQTTAPETSPSTVVTSTANRITYQYHTNRTEETFDTPQGLNITRGLEDLRDRFDLTYQYGVAPRDYTMTRAPYPSEGSLQTLIVEEAIPTVLALNTTRTGIPSLVIISAGSQRFDIYKGPFTKNDQLTASPFVNEFLYIPDVPFEAATAVLPELNRAGAERLWGQEQEEGEGEGEERQMRLWRQERAVEKGYVEWIGDMQRRYRARAGAALQGELTSGYVTEDSCPGDGDDVPHEPLPVYPVPDFIASRTPEGVDVDKVDLIFVDFIRGQVIRTLNEVQRTRVYSMADTRVYSPVLTNELLGIYAGVAWN